MKAAAVQTHRHKQVRVSKKMKFRGCKVWPYLFSMPFVIGYLVFNLYPTLYSLYLSFFDWSGIGDKVFVGYDNYIDLFTIDPLFLKSIGNTMILMLMSIPPTIVLGVLMATIMFNLTKGKAFFQTISFMPYITTPVAIGFIFSYMFDWSAGFVNTILVNLGIIQENFFWLQSPFAARCIVAIMFIWRYTGYMMVICLAGMTSIPGDVYEAAKVDGARAIRTFFSITLPLLKNIVIFLVVTSIIGGFQLFDEPVLLMSGWSNIGNVGGPEYSLFTVMWKFYDDAFKSNSMLGYASAISYTLFMLVVVFSIISFKIMNGKEEE